MIKDVIAWHILQKTNQTMRENIVEPSDRKRTTKRGKSVTEKRKKICVKKKGNENCKILYVGNRIHVANSQIVIVCVR